MVHVISLGVLAFAVSLDGFGVGITYGLRKIRISLLSILIIACCSGVVIYASMQIGEYLLQFMSVNSAKAFGAVILICIGMWAVIQVRKTNTQDQDELSGPMDNFPNLLEILRAPARADVDRSGNISSSEAAVLGIALSLDAFGAGIGAALIGFPPTLTAAVIAVASGTFIALGLRTGYIFSGIHWVKKLTILPGCILVIMGILKLM